MVLRNDDNEQVVVNAIELWITRALMDISQRKLSQAVKWLDKAKAKTTKLGSESLKRHWENRYKEVLEHLRICELFPLQPIKPFEMRFRIYSQSTVNRDIYECFNGLSNLIRNNVFVKELKIPATIEFDDHDPCAMHAHVLMGDALYCYARLWICEGRPNSGVRWAVLDRLCTANNSKRNSAGVMEGINQRNKVPFF
jgi:hypothetical protein